MPKIESFKPVNAKSHTPPYKIHRYFARRPWNVFDELVKHYSVEGGIILDPFAGGGVTPYEAVKNSVKVVACDLNPLSNYIVRNMFHASQLEETTQAFEEVYQYAKELNRTSFETTCSHCNESVIADWFELAHTVGCELCESTITLTESNKVRNGVYKCSNSKCWNSKNGQKVARSKRGAPVYLSLRGKCVHCKTSYSMDVDDKKLDDIRFEISQLSKQVKKKKAALKDEVIPLEWDRQKEDLLHEKGFNNFQDLFTQKNLLTNYLVLDKIKSYKSSKEVYEVLRFVFSDSLRDTNIMTFTNAGWQGGTPSSWAKHAYWLPATFCEVNISHSLMKSFGSIKKSVQYNADLGIEANFAKNFKELQRDKNIYVKTGTVANAGIPDDSVDAVITDPPYGSNVQYLELSHFWYMWNKDLYETANVGYESEAVVNRKRSLKNAKTYQVYENNLFSVFNECNRVLKPGGYMVMTFNNKDINSWLALLISIFRSGFHFEEGGISFQDGVSQYKHTAHTKAKNSPYGDFLYEFVKDKKRNSVSAKHINREELAEHITERIKEAINKYNNGEDRNLVLIELFNGIVPEIERFVRLMEDTENVHDLYTIFSKSGLEPLYA